MRRVPPLADAIYARINCFGLGDWLARCGLTLPVAVLPPGQRRDCAAPGLIVTLRAVVSSPGPADLRDALVLERAVFDGRGAVPLGLDVTGQTRDSARAALSDDCVDGATAADRRVSYFMPGARVVELTFRPGYVGLERIALARLGAPLDWRRSQGDP